MLPGVSSKALYSRLNPADIMLGKVSNKLSAKTIDCMQMNCLCIYAKHGWQCPEICLLSPWAAVYVHQACSTAIFRG